MNCSSIATSGSSSSSDPLWSRWSLFPSRAAVNFILSFLSFELDLRADECLDFRCRLSVVGDSDMEKTRCSFSHTVTLNGCLKSAPINLRPAAARDFLQMGSIIMLLTSSTLSPTPAIELSCHYVGKRLNLALLLLSSSETCMLYIPFPAYLAWIHTSKWNLSLSLTPASHVQMNSPLISPHVSQGCDWYEG